MGCVWNVDHRQLILRSVIYQISGSSLTDDRFSDNYKNFRNENLKFKFMLLTTDGNIL